MVVERLAHGGKELLAQLGLAGVAHAARCVRCSSVLLGRFGAGKRDAGTESPVVCSPARAGIGRRGRHGTGKDGNGWPGGARQAWAAWECLGVSARQGSDGPGSDGQARHAKAGVVRHGQANKALHGSAGMAGCWKISAWTVAHGIAGKGRFGSGWQGIGGVAGTVRRFRRVPAREYPARHGRLGKARCVGTWMWWAWQSIVRQAGRAARGRQGTVMGGMAWRAGPLWCGQAADGTA